MQKLNIPLSRHTKTTRPLRQVVWLLGFFALVLVFVTWRAGEMWFSRDSILQAAPEGTILAVQLELTSANWPLAQKILATLPLVSNRSLDIHDISSLVRGEIALFVTATGERAVAIRVDDQGLPMELFNALSITTQEITPGIVLLAETLLPISGINSSTRHPLFPSLSKHWLGRVELPDVGLSGSLYEKDEQLEIQFPNQDKAAYAKKILPKTMLALSNSSRDTSIDLEQDFGAFSNFFNEEWTVIVETSDSGNPDLVFHGKKGAMEKTELLSILQLMGAYLSPRIQESALPDGSRIREVMIEPELVTVEEIQLGEVEVLHVLGSSGQSIYGAFIDDQAVFSTSAQMLQTRNPESDSASPCQGNILHLEPSVLLDSITTSYNQHLQVLQSLFSHFSAISIEMKKYSSAVGFCST